MSGRKYSARKQPWLSLLSGFRSGLLIVGVLCMVVPAGAEDNLPDPESRTSLLKEYVSRGLRQNAGLKAAHESYQAAMARIPQAKSLPAPMLDYTHYLESIETRTGPQESRIGFSQVFPWFDTLKLRGDKAALQAEIEAYRLKETELNLVRDIKMVFFEMVYLEEALKILGNNLHLLKRLEKVVQAKVQGGASQRDLIRLQVEIGKMENQFITLTRQKPALQARMNALLNDPEGNTQDWPDYHSWSDFKLQQGELEEVMLESNMALAIARQKQLAEELGIRLASRTGYPDFKLGLTYFETGEAIHPGTPDSGSDPILLSFGLRLPLWRKASRSAKREAEARSGAAEERVRQTEVHLKAQLADLLFRQDDATRQVNLYQDTLIPKARQALEITEGSYRSGESSLLDVIDSQRILLEFEKHYYRALTRNEQSIAEIVFICGKRQL